MERRDQVLAILVGTITIVCGIVFKLDYAPIAESGLTLSSIVLAVYIAAIIGLINSDLAKKMSKTVASPSNDKTQLGILTHYFKVACFASICTILVSSLVLLLPKPILDDENVVFHHFRKGMSLLGLLSYIENLVFLAIIIRFMLNRQIWNK